MVQKSPKPQNKDGRVKKHPKRQTRTSKAVYQSILSAESTCGNKLRHVLHDLDAAIRDLTTVFGDLASLPVPKPTRNGSSFCRLVLKPGVSDDTPCTHPDAQGSPFDKALKSLRLGIQHLDNFPLSVNIGQHIETTQIAPPQKLPLKKAALQTQQPRTPSLATPPNPVDPPQQIPLTTVQPHNQKRTTPKTSPHFQPPDPFSQTLTPPGLPFPLQPSTYGLIQERIRPSLYALVVQAILWNQTTATAARPVLFTLLTRYPTPEALALASPSDIRAIIRPLGLQNLRSERLVKLAQTWVSAPPSPLRRYGKRDYPHPGENRDTRDGELLDVDDVRDGWEIAHLPGIGAYALDSYPIFYRDTLRGVTEGYGIEPEWKRVVPLDKDLRPYLRCRWRREGWEWDPLTGRKERLK
ncbi:DNA glycosylase [Sporormia fimetaria CBS 119925]|uniref:DNA glycosylase n=1 Tax=Sporormia fimetaria CBS 119925 TaxID=1340428 RepID=A0A6A6VA97_9PLEO|nr:DNA glycosylase [Sporormia fimetaria CBS 119925]